MPESASPEFNFANSTAAAAVNHLLRSAAWARAELARHAGKTACFELFPAGFSLCVTVEGTVSSAAPGAAPDVTLRITPGVMLRLAARDETAWLDIGTTGDTAFAEAIAQLARNLRWDFEEDLSRIFGDIAAHRMAGSARTLAGWGRESADGIVRSLAEYWTEERPLVATARDVRAFNHDVDDLRDAVARLEKRLDSAMKAMPPGPAN